MSREQLDTHALQCGRRGERIPVGRPEAEVLRLQQRGGSKSYPEQEWPEPIRLPWFGENESKTAGADGGGHDNCNLLNEGPNKGRF